MSKESPEVEAPVQETPVRSTARKLAELAVIVLIILAGMGLRMLHLDARPFGVDEAESSINALTILEHDSQRTG